jgi:tight adherence protein C
MIYITLFLFVTLLIYGLLLIHVEKNEKFKKRMAVFLNGQRDLEAKSLSKEGNQSFIERFVRPYWIDFKRSFKKRMPGEKEAKLEKKLLLAGINITPVDFRLIQISLFIILPLVSTVYAILLQKGTGIVILFFFLGLMMSIFLPNNYLKSKKKTRNKMALKELPDILDLLTVSLEAGLGFDLALNKVVAKKQGIISDEFHRCLEEIRLGKTRREALSGIRDRLEVDEINSFIGSILQAEKLGIGMVQVLRVQSQEVREKRKQRAEEQAMKAPVKMLFPLILFIFPSLFIVLLGPAIIQFIDLFSK